ncbi:MAG TPA: PLP-dependent aminotransferase family protein [Pseudonocardiaceae bacterium]|jgi:GntR family transcriptional regulator/MocR family aminotransferase|nr:PLP-dependent aminotransferase family protein [Pseudonocardiaceae bacterium]
MAIDWSTSGLDLHLDRDPGQPRWSGLAGAIRTAVRDGRLLAGTRLPPTRALAADLGLARGTVTRAYEELAAEGYLRTRQGAGTVVALLPEPVAATTPRTPAVPLPTRWTLRPGRPDVSVFPTTRWLAAARRALAGASAADFDYGDPFGHPRLRATLAGYLGRTRGVVAPPDRIVVCAGYTQGLALLATVLRERGATRFAFEEPSLTMFREVVRATGLDTVGVDVDEHGLRVADLPADGAPELGAVVVTPAHQFPLGHTLHPHRRAALVEYAHRTGTLIIEDDYDGEFRFDRQPVGALQALAPDRVAYAGTASKTLAPGLRLGWLVLPSWLVEPAREAHLALGRHPAVGVVDQLTLAEFIGSGDYDQHIRRCRVRYRRRRDRLLGALREAGRPLPAGIAAGLHVLLPLEPGRTEADLARAVARESVEVEMLGDCWTTPGPHPPGVIVGYAAPPDHAFGPAVRALLAALR